MGGPWQSFTQGSPISPRRNHLLPHLFEAASNRAAVLYPEIRAIQTLYSSAQQQQEANDLDPLTEKGQ